MEIICCAHCVATYTAEYKCFQICLWKPMSAGRKQPRGGSATSRTLSTHLLNRDHSMAGMAYLYPLHKFHVYKLVLKFFHIYNCRKQRTTSQYWGREDLFKNHLYTTSRIFAYIIVDPLQWIYLNVHIAQETEVNLNSDIFYCTVFCTYFSMSVFFLY